MNPRQRRGALLLVITALGAIAVFFAVVVYVGDVSSRVGPMTQALQLNRAVDAFEPVEPDMFDVVEVPQRWLPSTAVGDVAQTSGLVAAAALPEGVMLQEGMLVPRPGVQPGYREVAIVVDAETGVAGKVAPGDHVDIVATIAGDDDVPARSEIWVSNVLVLEVGLPREVESSDANGNFGNTQGVPVTFALTSQDALRLAYVESFSVKLRLALRGDGDDAVLSDDQLVFQVG
ncbi:Flp pilus assembly protein CpaB [Cellulomonas dongxiuzhuiae]|uniref:Flp pilus assembly protein CpaB n=1 Tax=Cellulomonas dongxiuzhuiae TaxID=2819979 RepID=A0ABX8GGE3_9CELL|nr:Flp pilus assembly protein CpaB [Cellulomonas dongxiuzhuiae]MBO3088542.1 Flp pilus assembly protein CpaB [Cellulomonas dongxiuzhuiae]MBO3094125.1 Flp pilus assembly protein CpaB [Cellulomonas dongxiuzhuiae]QWC15189.1 Flp pilus assembly protein CpaB [Cellulomonas dongxiuzhuiae]